MMDTTSSDTSISTAPPRDASNDTGLDVVTGAFSYCGQAIARQLQEAGRQVRTLTGHPGRAGGRDDIEVRPLDFDDPAGTGRRRFGARRRCTTPTGSDSPTAGSTTRWRWRTPASCSRRPEGPRVRKIVHVSILHPSVDSPYGYFRGKALVEQALAEVGLRVRRTAPVGALRRTRRAAQQHRLAAATVAGFRRGRRPATTASVPPTSTIWPSVAIEAAAWPDDRVVDAVGPDRPTFVELVRQIRAAVGSRARVVRVPGAGAARCVEVLGLALRDVVLTTEEYRSMARGTGRLRCPRHRLRRGAAVDRPARRNARAAATPTSSTSISGNRCARAGPARIWPDR